MRSTASATWRGRIIAHSRTAETTYVPASSTKAAPRTALSAVTIIPAIGKPMRSAAVSGTDSAELATTRSRSPTTAGMTAVFAGRKRRVTVAIAKAIA